MAEYIERLKVLKEMHVSHTLPFFTRRRTDEDIMFCQMVDIVAGQPAADVVEVVHAYWDKDCVTGIMCCSNCRMPPPGDAELQDFYESPYCQSCGAKMDANSKSTLPETTRQTVLNSFMKVSEV